MVGIRKIGINTKQFGSGGGGESYCDEYQAVYDSFTTKPSAAVAAAQNTMVESLVDAGVWTKLDVFYLFAQESNGDGEALKNWINPGTYDGTAYNSPTFTSLEGFTGNGSDAYIDSLTFSTDATHYTGNNCSYGCYLHTEPSLSVNGLLGTLDESYDGYLAVQPRVNVSGEKLRFIGNSLGCDERIAYTASKGMLIGSVINNTLYCYRNGSPIGSDAGSGSYALSSNSTVILALRGGVDGDTITAFTEDQLGCVFFGANLSPTEVSDLTDAIEAYMSESFFFSIISNRLSVKVDGTGDYTTIQAAIDSISDASADKMYCVDVYDDFTVTQANEYTNVDGSYYRYIKLKDHVYLMGVENPVIDCTLPETATDDQTKYYENCVANAETGAYGITFRQRNGRYALHIDDSDAADKKQRFDNCTFTHYGNQEVIDYRIDQSQAYSGVGPGLNALGLGSHSGNEMEFNDCIINSIKPIGWHTNVNFTTVAPLTLNRCTITSEEWVNTTYNPTGAKLENMNLYCLTSELQNPVVIDNCTMNSWIEYWGTYYNQTQTDLYILNDITVKSYDTVLDFRNTFTTGGSLRITSASTSVSITGGTAESLIMPSADEVSTYATGRLEVAEYSRNTDVKLGARLGDCSSVSKTLEMSIDGGGTTTVTFDEDFSAATNAYILAFIDTSLAGAATASLYQRARDYTATEV